MTYFLKNGNTYKPASEDAIDLKKSLPAKTLVVKMDPYGAFFFEEVEGFNRLPKYYGDIEKNAKRIYDTFLDRPRSTGLMLSGEKGSGKTLLAKLLSIKAAEEGIPTILINMPWAGEGFNQLLQMITQPAIVIFDEFEKIYPKDKQEQILTLLDGVFESKKLFILTCNDKYKVDVNMKNRPGRIYYMLEFFGLEDNFVVDYCKDKLKNQTYIDQIVKVKGFFDNFNFDMLQALVEEMNRYDENPIDALKLLNVKPEFAANQNFDVSIVVHGKALPKEQLFDNLWSGNIYSIDYDFGYELNPDDDNEEAKYAHASGGTLRHIDQWGGRYTFICPGGEQVILTKQHGYTYKWSDAIGD